MLAFILSLYVLTLTTIPCVDVSSDHHEHSTELTYPASGHHGDETDHCSPFCTCDCCVPPIIIHSPAPFNSIVPLAQELTTAYHIPFVTIPFASIWQPPKIS